MRSRLRTCVISRSHHYGDIHLSMIIHNMLAVTADTRPATAPPALLPYCAGPNGSWPSAERATLAGGRWGGGWAMPPQRSLWRRPVSTCGVALTGGPHYLQAYREWPSSARAAAGGGPGLRMAPYMYKGSVSD